MKGNTKEVAIKFSEGPKYFRFVVFPASTLGETRSIPAQIDTAIPQYPIGAGESMEHPQEMSITTGVRLKALIPGNNSTLVQEHPLELTSEVLVE